MRRSRKVSAIALLACSALVLSACGGDDDEGDEGGVQSDPDRQTQQVTITFANDQEFDTYNQTTATGNSFKNGIVLSRVLTGFWYFGEDGVVTRDEEYGTFEKTSDDPLTVEYSIGAETAWSDGEPIDCDDVLMWWAQQSGAMDGLFSAIGTQGVEDTEMPDCEAGGKDFALVYDTPFADWEANGPSSGNTTMMPAHVVADQGGLTGEELIQAIKDEDADALADAAEFFNSGWTFTGGLPDEALLPSSGPYKVAAYDPGQSMTIEANENYWGTPPASSTIVVRWVAQDEQAQALQNQDVEVIFPQPSADLKAQVDALEGVEVAAHDQYIYEHLDFNFDSSDFGDSLELRQAFAKCVPRQTILENLIHPIDESFQTQDVRNIAPFEPGYDDVVAATNAADYAEPDIEGARELLEGEDAVGMEVRLGFIDGNKRRADTATLIKDSCDEAGFDVQINAEDTFFDEGGGLSSNTYDVAMFAWVGSSLVSGWNSTFKSVDECTEQGKGNNNGCYNSDEMDALLEQIVAEPDRDAQIELTKQIEQLLWEDMVTIPLFAHPGIAAWSAGLGNVIPNPAQSGITWNVSDWTKE